MTQGGANMGNAIADRGQNRMAGDAYMGKPGAMEKLMQFNPKVGMEITQQKQVAEQQKLQKAAQTQKDLSAMLAKKREVFSAEVEKAAKLGTPEEFVSHLENFRESLRPEFGDVVDSIPDPTAEMYEQAKQMHGSDKGAPGGKIGTVNPRDWTSESVAKYEAGGSIGDLVRYKGDIKKIAGVEHQYNQESMKWEPLVDMRSEGLTTQTSALAEIEAAKQSKLDFTKAQSKFKNTESKIVSKISSVGSNHKILKTTATKLKDLLGVLNTGWGAALRNVPDTEARELEGLINTMKANSAFSTLTDLKDSGGTLGAISAPELVLLEAKLGALDQYGDIPEQIRIVDQILAANLSSIGRVKNAYSMDKKKFGSSFEKVMEMNIKPKEGNAIDDLVNKYAD